MTDNKKSKEQKRINIKNRYKIEAENVFGKMKISFCDCTGIGEYTSEVIEVISGINSVFIHGKELKLSVLEGGIAIISGKVFDIVF